MSNSYHLRNDQSTIKIKVKVGTIGNVSTIIRKHRTGGSHEEIARSTKTSAGNIEPLKLLGISSELIGANVVVSVADLLDGVPKQQLDQAFENIFIRVTLSGGLDGEQFFDIAPNEKMQFMDKKLIMAAKSIKLITQ